MKLGTLLLGTAAALTLASAAQAADLPTEPTPAAVDYVKVCDTYGTGFFFIPGTETCLDISGRVRAGIATGPAYATSGVTNAFADGRFDFDARSATELGTLRSFFRVSSNADATVSVTKAFISLGYLTTGYASNFFDSFGGLFGDNDRNWGGATSLQVSLLSSDLGGGFYAGFQALSPTKFGKLSTNFDGGTFFPDGNASIPDFQAILGIKDQPWGSAAIAAWYSDEGEKDGQGDSFWAVKAAATFKATNELSIAGQTYYQDIKTGNSTWEIGLGASYAASDALTINVNGEYVFVDRPTPGDADTWGATLGADYTIVKGLVATAEVSYGDGKIVPSEISGLFRLTREW